MQQLQHALQALDETVSRARLVLFVRAVQSRLDQFDVPVAEFTPDQFVDLLGGQRELEALHIRVDLGQRVVDGLQDPAVFGLQLRGRLVRHGQEVAFLVLDVHDGETGCVPQLVREVSGAFDLFHLVADIGTRGDAGQQHEAQRVGAVSVDHFERIDAVAQRFGHLAALRVAHEAVDEHVLERRLAHDFDAGEDHSRDPEENNVVAGDERARRVELFQIVRIFRPAQGRERPQRGAEPGIQHVFVLMEMRTAALRADGGFFLGYDHFAAVFAVIRRDAVTPPELAGDAPVLDVLHPVIIGLIETFGHELRLVLADGFDRGLCQRLHLHEPLFGDARLHDSVAAVAFACRDHHLFDLYEIARGFQIGDPGLAALVAVHAFVLACSGGHLRFFVDAFDHLQTVAQTDFEVVGVRGRRDLYGAGALFGIGILVRDDGDLSADQRQDDLLAHQVPVAFVARMDGDGRIGEHGLRTGRGDDDAFAAVRAGIAEVPVAAVVVHVFDFDIGQGGSADRAPVDQARAFIDQAFVVQVDEVLLDRSVASFVHGEAFALPVAGGAQTPDLLVDAASVLSLPFPGALQESFAADILLGQSFLFPQLIHDLDFRGDGRVVRARQPQRFVALHPLVADQHVLQGLVQGVTHVQLPGDVGRRHHDGKGVLRRVRVGSKSAVLLPLRVDAVFEILRSVILCEIVFHNDPLYLN